MGKIYQVFLMGIQNEKKLIDVASSEKAFNNTTVAELKQKICQKLSQVASDPSALRLIYSDKQLEDPDKLSAHGIKDKSTIFIITRLQGGR